MVSPTTDRRLGLVGNTAFKAPVTVLASSNITQSGQQTIDGVAVLASNASSVADRVLCVGQTDATQNGIWDVSTTSWTRSKDADGNYDLVQGSTVQVTQGSTYAGQYWRVATSGSITVGTTALAWTQALATSAQATSFTLNYTGAALQDLQTVLRNLGGVSVTQFMLPADLADMALTTPLRDQTANFQAAINAYRKVVMPVGNFRIDAGNILVPDGTQLLGAGSLQSGGSSIRFTKVDGTDCFISDSTKFLSAVTFQGMEIVNVTNPAGTIGTGNAALYAAGSPGTGNAFKMSALTNNCKFKDVMVRNFGGSGWSIGRQSTTLTDHTALQNVTFEQCFAVSCGGYAFDVNGFVVATWLMCDVNSCATGYWRFQDGTTNQTVINLIGCWVEGTQTWTALTAIEMLDTKGQLLNLVGCNFVNGHSGLRVVKSTTSSCRLSVANCTGFGWAAGHEDTPVGNTVTLDTPWNYSYQPTGRQLILKGSGPVLDWQLDVGGTVDQRRFRSSISGSDLLWSARDDTGASVRNLFKINHVTGAFVPAVDVAYDFGSTTLRWANTYVSKVHLSGSATIFDSAGTGTPEGVVTAGVGSTFRRTDGGAGTSFYVKETGSGNTGWVGK